MKKIRLIGLFPCLLILAAAAFLIPREPMYQWWTLKRWVDVKKRSRGPMHRSIVNLAKVDEDGVQFFISGLSHDDEYIREGSSELLIDCGSNALPALTECLSSEDPRVQKGALSVFEQMDLVRVGRAYTALVRAHDSNDAEFRKRVGDLLLDHLIRAELPRAEAILTEYQRNLQSKHSEVRFWAAYILALNGLQFEGMPAILMANLEHPDGKNRWHAVSALTVMKEDPKLLEAAFVKSLKDSDARVQIQAMKALIHLGAQGAEAAGPFLELVDDKRAEVRALAFKGLRVFRSQDEKILPQLVRLLDSKTLFTRNFAAKELIRFGAKARPAVPSVVKILERSAERPKQELLIRILGKIGSGSEEGGLAILSFLESKDEALQSLAMGTLQRMELTGARLRERLVAMLKDPVRRTRMRGGRLLGRMGAEAEPALPALVEAVYTKRILHSNVRESFILIGEHVDSVALHVARYLRFEENWTQAPWVKAILLSMGDRARPALPVLRDILKTGGLKRRCEVVELLDIFAEAGGPLLSLALEDKSHVVRLSALKVLQKIGLKGKAVAPDLIVFLKDSKGSLRREVAKTLGMICLDVDETFLSVLKGPNSELKGLVFVILQLMTSRARKAIPALFEETKNKELWVRESAFDTLWKIGPAAVPKLLILLNSDDSDTRRCAAYALGNIGVLAKQAVPSLKKCLEDEDPNVRKGARFALKKIVGLPK